MEQLKVIGVEDGVLVLATDSGDRFSLAVDETLRSQLRRATKEPETRAPRPSPRDIQAHIRAGLSAEEVAALLGIRVEDVARYEGPVLAEREHIVGQALAVPVLISGELDPDSQPTFGAAVRAKLAEAGATGERWTSWREQTGWVVKLEFTAGEVERDARWSFDPRRSTLSPQNADATQLSRQGSLPEGLIPRLRALDANGVKDASRFDSGAFGPRRLPDADIDTPDVREPVSPAVQQAAIKRAPAQGVTSTDTADLLEALRRRRGQREAMPGEADDASPTTSASPRGSSPVALFDALEPGYDESPEDAGAPAESPVPSSTPEESPASDAQQSEGGRRKGRTSMPSWDEIVFGARTEDG